MEIGDRKMFLSSQDLFDAWSGAVASGDEEMYMFLLPQLEAFWRDTGADGSNPNIEDDLDSEAPDLTFEEETELFGSHAGIIEIPFRDTNLVEKIAGYISVGKVEREDGQYFVESSTSELQALERNRRRERFGGRPPYLRPVPPEQQ